MIPAYKKLSMEELVDVLAQKTQVFTQLLVEKKFDEEYLQAKESIQQLLSEIELRKETSTASDLQKEQPGPGMPGI